MCGIADSEAETFQGLLKHPTAIKVPRRVQLYQNLKLTPLAKVSYGTEVNRLIFLNAPLVILVYLMMAAVAAVFLSASQYYRNSPSRPSFGALWKASRILQALGGVVSVIFSTLMGFGFCTLIGKSTVSKEDLAGSSLPFNTLLMILPFLLVAIGIDDMFLIVNMFHGSAQKELPIAARAGAALQHAGPAILFTTLTDIMAFALGAMLSSTPVIRIFCTYAAVCIGKFDFLTACIYWIRRLYF